MLSKQHPRRIPVNSLLPRCGSFSIWFCHVDFPQQSQYKRSLSISLWLQFWLIATVWHRLQVYLYPLVDMKYVYSVRSILAANPIKISCFYLLILCCMSYKCLLNGQSCDLDLYLWNLLTCIVDLVQLNFYAKKTKQSNDIRGILLHSKLRSSEVNEWVSIMFYGAAVVVIIIDTQFMQVYIHMHADLKYFEYLYMFLDWG